MDEVDGRKAIVEENLQSRGEFRNKFPNEYKISVIDIN